MTDGGEILRARVLRLMEAKGYSARRLSLDSGLAADSVRNLTTGRSQRPTKDTLEKIAKTLGVQISDLVDDTAPLPTFARSPGVELKEFDLREVPGSDGDLLFGRPNLHLWLVPADLLRVKSLPEDKTCIVRVDTPIEGLAAGDRLLVDVSRKSLYPYGLAIIYIAEGQQYDLARIKPAPGLSGRGSGGMAVELEFSWGVVQWAPSDIHVAGRVVGRWQWL